MKNEPMITNDECEVCYKIICRGCQWEPDETELLQIQQGTLTVCPVCGWKPGSTVDS